MRLLFILSIVFYFWLIWDDLLNADEKWTPEFREFCEKYMPYVNKYKGINAGCCDIDHPSNDILKEGWKGESLLFCDDKQIL